MKTHGSHNDQRFPLLDRQGFAIIVCLVVMSLLILLATALLMLSRSSARVSAAKDPQDIARANARMALNLALSELQLELGDDRRATAPGSQWESASHPRLVAVYDSRSMEEELSNRLPSDYYKRGSKFRKWLVSHPDPSALGNENFITTANFPDPVTLWERRNDPADTLIGSKILVENGAYAWVIEDESFKARFDPAPVSRLPQDLAGETMAFATPGSLGHQIIDEFSNADLDDPNLQKLISSRVREVLPNDSGDLEEWFSHFSIHSEGLLTDPKLGGLKRDLNLLLEMPEDQLPAEFQQNVGLQTRWMGNRNFNDQTLSGYVQDSMSEASSGSAADLDTLPITLLHRYYSHYKLGTLQNGLVNNDGSRSRLVNRKPALTLHQASNGSINDQVWRGYGHSMRLAPVIARIRDVVWATAVDNGDSTYTLQFISFPVVTLWNPYNIETTFGFGWIQYKAHPTDALVDFQGREYRVGVGGSSRMRFGGMAGQPEVTLAAGESKVFFPDFDSSSYSSINLVNRWPSNLSQIRRFASANAPVRGPGAARVTLGLEPENSTTRYHESHRNDGWLSNSYGSYQTHKFHNWTYDLSQIWEHIDGGDDALTSSLRDLARRPRPIGIVDLGLKSADDEEQPGLLWEFDFPHRMNPHLLYPAGNAPSQSLGSSDVKGLLHASTQLYRYIPLRGDTDLSAYLSTDEDSLGVHDYMGFSRTPSTGSSYLTICEMPLVPLTSLPQLQHLPLLDNKWTHDEPFPISPTWTFAIGNSKAHPWLSTSELSDSRNVVLAHHTRKEFAGRHPMIDRQSVANSALFDSFFFSSITPQIAPWFRSFGNARGVREVITEASEKESPLPNPSYVIDSRLSGDELYQQHFGSRGVPLDEAFEKIAAHLKVHGGFNVNSTSEKAWKFILASTFKKAVVTNPSNPQEAVGSSESDGFPVSRYSVPNGPSIDREGDPYVNAYNGYRELNEDQLTELARAIVLEVKQRGPFRSLAEFVNRRRVGAQDDPRVLVGAVGAALEQDSVSINDVYRDAGDRQSRDLPLTDFITPEAVRGSRASGLPGFVNQADILTPIAPILTTRGDTFKIRAYGEARDSSGNVVARAYCEAVVQRTIDFVDPVDQASTPVADLNSPANARLGRRFEIRSFRWLKEDEIAQ